MTCCCYLIGLPLAAGEEPNLNSYWTTNRLYIILLPAMKAVLVLLYVSKKNSCTVPKNKCHYVLQPQSDRCAFNRRLKHLQLFTECREPGSLFHTQQWTTHHPDKFWSTAQHTCECVGWPYWYIHRAVSWFLNITMTSLNFSRQASNAFHLECYAW